MRRTDINNALNQRLTEEPNLPTGTWPGVEPQHAVERPYFEVSFPTASRRSLSLKGTLIRETGSMAVILVTKYGTGEEEANLLADLLVDHFPVGYRMNIPNGLVTIDQPVEPRGGYRDDSDWKVPVMIPYTALKQ